MPSLYVVHYEVQGPADAAETGASSSFELPLEDRDAVPTVSQVREAFPYVGTYHFRAKFRSDREDYAWLDLTDEDAPLPVWNDEGRAQHIHLKALPLSFDGPEGDTEDVEEEVDWSERELEDGVYDVRAAGEEPSDLDSSAKGVMSKIKEATETVLTSEVARDLTKKGVQVTKQVGKQVGKLWSHLKAVATDAGGVSAAATPSPLALDVLQAAERSMSTNFSDAARGHTEALQELWRGLFPGQPFERTSSKWRTAGFQSEDPVADLKGTGLLCLSCMLYFTRTYTLKMQTILREQAGRSARTYPFAIVSNNLTLMLIDVLKLRDTRYVSTQAGYWVLFEYPQAVEELYTHSLLFLDRTWTERNATRDQFGKLIQHTRQQLETTLNQNPTSISHFKELAERVGF